MKIDLKFPGGELHIQREPREPMGEDRFNVICALVGIALFFGFLLAATH